MSKTANELVNFAKSKLGTNYVYGMKGAVLTDSKLRSLANSYPKYLTYNKEKGKSEQCVLTVADLLAGALVK